MTQWGLEAIFNPGKRHDDDERRRLEATREEAGDSSGGKRIDLGSGRVVISRPTSKPADTSDAADAADSGDAADSADAANTKDANTKDAKAAATGSSEKGGKPSSTRRRGRGR